MDDKLYKMIFRRKSFHVYKTMEKTGPEELEAIKKYYQDLKVLVPDIRTELRIVSVSETTMKRGEYALLLFSEKKEGYLENIGYIGEQLDLYLASMNIGVCWYGAGKLQRPQTSELEFVIMLSIAKVPEDSFRKDMFRSRRKSASEIWKDSGYPEIADIVRFAPSACNAQPWHVEDDDGVIAVYRDESIERRGIMPIAKQSYYARIDIGIFLCILELCLDKASLCYERRLFGKVSVQDRPPSAIYILTKKSGKLEKNYYSL